MANEEMLKEEEKFLKRLSEWEDLIENKTRIYSRLLTDAALAEDMELIADRHAKRKKTLTALITGEPVEEKKSKTSGAGTD